MLVTTHQFINSFPAKSNHRKAIFGTIHPPEISSFEIPFFYGNKGNFWHRFIDAFPHLDFTGLQNITQTLSDYDVWVSDVIKQCVHLDSLAADNKLTEMISNKKQLEEGLIKSQIDEIFFTSEFALTLFKRDFGIRVPFNRNTRELTIPSLYFGRPIRAVALYSPSHNANRGIASSNAYRLWSEEQRKNKQISSVDAFRVQHYREKMAFWSHV